MWDCGLARNGHGNGVKVQVTSIRRQRKDLFSLRVKLPHIPPFYLLKGGSTKHRKEHKGPFAIRVRAAYLSSVIVMS